jgi:hypothetical protein
MARVEDVREAEDVVRSLYNILTEFRNFETRKRGSTWVVKYNILTVLGGDEGHEAHIDAKTGKVLSNK